MYVYVIYIYIERERDFLIYTCTDAFEVDLDNIGPFSALIALLVTICSAAELTASETRRWNSPLSPSFAATAEAFVPFSAEALRNA